MARQASRSRSRAAIGGIRPKRSRNSSKRLPIVIDAPAAVSKGAIESTALIAEQMDIALARLRLPAAIREEFRGWAPSKEREAAFHFLLETWNAESDRRDGQVLSVTVFGHARDKYRRRTELRGALADAYRVCDEALKAIKQLMDWANRYPLEETRDAPWTLYLDVSPENDGKAKLE